MEKAKNSWTLLSIIGSIGGAALGIYAGINLLVPGIITFGAFFWFNRVFPPNKRPVLAAIAWQMGQLGWFLLGAILVANGINKVGLDVAIITVGLIWLYLSVGRAAAIALMLYQSAALAFNVYTFAAGSLASPGAKGLVVHIVWRAVALILLGYFVFNRQKKSADQEIAASFD